jgi:long-chain fatty acid transport protein
MHKRRSTAAAATLVALVALAVSTDAMAAGFYLPGHGVKPMGRGGAQVAHGQGDLNAIWHNPANIGGLTNTKLTVDFSLIFVNFDFQRAPRTLENGEQRTYNAVSNEAPPKPNPQVLIGGPLPVEGMSWAFGLYAPYLSGHVFPETGPQRYTLVDNDQSLLLFLHAVWAWELNDRIRIGLGFQNVPANFVLVNVTSAYTGLFGDPEDADLDILTRITLTDLWVPSGNGGVVVGLSENLSAGLSFQLPIRFETDSAQLESRLPSNAAFTGAELQGDTIAGGLTFAPIIRFGLQWQAETWDVELAATYEAWSVFDEIDATPNSVSVDNVPGLGAIPIGPLSVAQEWQDAYSVRLGSDVQLSDALTVRGGYAFETAAVPDERYSVFLADGNKHLLGTGLTYDFGDLSLDAGLAGWFIPERVITNSRVTQINPTDGDNEQVIVVGNGTYNQFYYAAGIGLNYDF